MDPIISNPSPANTSAADPPPIASTSRLAPPPPGPTLRPSSRGPATVPFFASAAQPEIVRANQKDLYYLSELSGRIEDVARTLLGPRWLQKWSLELAQGTKLAYFGLTTLLGTQTLGEEYVDILQYSSKSRKPASPKRRAFLLSLHILTPYLLSRLYSRLRRHLIAQHATNLAAAVQANNLDDLFASSKPLPPPPPKTQYERVRDWLARHAEEGPSFEDLTADYLRSVHLAVFYLWGRYYHISKRVAGIRFISTQPGRSVPSPSSSSATSQSSPAPSSYEVLGVLMAVQLAVRALLALRRHRAAAKEEAHAQAQAEAEAEAEADAAELEAAGRGEKAGVGKVGKEEGVEAGKGKGKEKAEFAVDGRPLRLAVFDPDDPESGSAYPEEEEGEDARDRRCTLCLGPRRDPAVTECGHVFCWECVVGWARDKAECPLCRQRIQLNRLLPVYNL